MYNSDLFIESLFACLNKYGISIFCLLYYRCNKLLHINNAKLSNTPHYTESLKTGLFNLLRFRVNQITTIEAETLK